MNMETTHMLHARAIFNGKTDTGLKRSSNEDAFVIKTPQGLCALADGMGGAAAGEVASRIFTESAAETFGDMGILSEQKAVELVQETFRTANDRILTHVVENPEHQGMGCTVEIMVLCDNRYVIGHIGDSRTYLFREGELRQLTKDHSFVQEQVDRGLMTSEEAKKHRFRNIILRAVGTNETLAVDILRGRLLPGDVFLLCSDGLTDMVHDSVIRDILLSGNGLDRKVDLLIEQANSQGGCDNTTVILVQAI